MGLDAAFHGTRAVDRRLKIFIDFWDVVNAARDQSDRFRAEISWESLVTYVIHQTYGDHSLSMSDSLAGCYIFGTFGTSEQDNDFIIRTIERYGALPGVFFEFLNQPEPQTPDRTYRSGIDVALAVEMIRHARLGEHDHLALVSSQPGYLPLFRYLKDQGQRAVHVTTSCLDDDLRCNSWRQIEMRLSLPVLCEIDHDKVVALVGNRSDSAEDELRLLLKQRATELDFVDLSDPASINDKDLLFIVCNQRIALRNSEQGRDYYGYGTYPEFIAEFRQGLGSGIIAGELPYVMRNGHMVMHNDGKGGWVRSPLADL